MTKRRAPTKWEWILLAVSISPGPLLGFSFAFNPGTCNSSFTDVNFMALLAFGIVTSAGSLYCLKRAFLG